MDDGDAGRAAAAVVLFEIRKISGVGIIYFFFSGEFGVVGGSYPLVAHG
jgi:hypothetical protein